MLESGMENTHLKDLDPKKFNLKRLSDDKLRSYMISQKLDSK